MLGCSPRCEFCARDMCRVFSPVRVSRVQCVEAKPVCIALCIHSSKRANIDTAVRLVISRRPIPGRGTAGESSPPAPSSSRGSTPSASGGRPVSVRRPPPRRRRRCRPPADAVVGDLPGTPNCRYRSKLGIAAASHCLLASMRHLHQLLGATVPQSPSMYRNPWGAIGYWPYQRFLGHGECLDQPRFCPSSPP